MVSLDNLDRLHPFPSHLRCAPPSLGASWPLSSPTSPQTKYATSSTFCAVADNFTDIGPAINSAFNDCVQNSPMSTLLIPPGNYALKSVVAVGGSDWTFQWQGNVIVPFNSTLHGNMITFNRSSNWIFNGEGGVLNGQGHLWRTQGPFFANRPRLMKIWASSSFKFHGLNLIESPMFHLNVEECQQSEVYKLSIMIDKIIYSITIEGAQIGATDDIDLSGIATFIMITGVDTVNGRRERKESSHGVYGPPATNRGGIISEYGRKPGT
ncbi:pectin lyase fold/virulence factor [Blyttiomyces helicus]|uniref:Pectin lyase fold/virulence factor n=1 Tax=Blyttiomyces helicus TaxID=388810 RepID=A0A4P9W649_9FUNG|nr:pectin lyase fold/virulence factor [Blyttiomyces helicus]|eukprot:RKO87774.1 pectin lyase fold/virulence factor [Blyttiomyces helicus]